MGQAVGEDLLKRNDQGKGSRPITHAVGGDLAENTVPHTLGQAISKPFSLFNTLLTKTSNTETDISSESEYTTYEEVFKVSEKYFSGVIIFSFLNGEFTPIKWSSNLKGSPTPVKTEKPSLFRMTVQSVALIMVLLYIMSNIKVFLRNGVLANLLSMSPVYLCLTM